MGVIGTFDDILALEPQHAPLLRAVRSLVLSDKPDAVEVARPGDRAVCWGWGPKKMSEAYVYALPYKKHVNVGFFQGATLPDPQAILEGTGKSMRHTKLKEPEQTENPALLALIAAAREERRAALSL